MRVTWLISPNGLGHARRSLAIATALRAVQPAIQITLVGQAWQRERLGAHGFTWITRGMDAAPRWPQREPLAAWRPEAELVRDADLVVSDNLAGVLALRPDAVLAGSFLWSDVLAEQPACAGFVADERALLQAHRPPMLCVDDVAMPGVAERTQAIRLPWMTERGPAWHGGGGVAVLGGASGASDAELGELARALDARSFDHRPESYAACDLVVCRPGVGTLTDCIASGTPMLLVPDASPEMAWNTERLVATGAARRFGGLAETRALLADRDALAAMSRAALARPTGGAREAAAFLSSRLAMSKELS